MSVHNLNVFFEPKIVALIASKKESNQAIRLIRHLIKHEYAGAVLPIIEGADTCAGIHSYSDLNALPSVPDLAMLLLPPEDWLEAIQDLVRVGCKGVVLLHDILPVPQLTPQLTKCLLEAASVNGLRILGPIQLGLASMIFKFNALQTDLPVPKGSIAFIGESCSIVRGVLDWGCAHDIGFSHVASLGNARIDIDYADMLDYLATDRHTRAIVVQLNSIRKPRKFMSAARIASRLKPVVVLKPHDQSFHQSDLIYDAAFSRAGLMRVSTLEDFMAAIETLHALKPLTQNGLMVVASAYSLGNMTLDTLRSHGGNIAMLSDETVTALQLALPQHFAKGFTDSLSDNIPQNPIKVGDYMPPENLKVVLEILIKERSLGGILVVNSATHQVRDTALAQIICDIATKTRIPIMASWIGGLHAKWAIDVLKKHHVAHYSSPSDAVTEFARASAYSARKKLLMETPTSLPTAFHVDHEAVRDVIMHAKTHNQQNLSAADSLKILHAYDIPVAKTYSIMGDTIDSVLRSLEDFTLAFSEPVVLKVCSAAPYDRSNSGGIRFALEGKTQILEAANTMIKRFLASFEAREFLGFEVQPMLTRGESFELNLGVENTHFGPLIRFGHGGVEADVIDDFAYALPPLNMLLADEAMSRTRIYKLLCRTDGARHADMSALQLVLIKVSQMVIDIPELAALNINPMWADSRGIRVLDAKIVLDFTQTQKTTHRLAIRPYPKELEQTIMIDETPFLMRPILPEDEPQLQIMVNQSPPEDVRMRFFQTIKELSHETAARLTQLDYEREMAFCLTKEGLAGTMPLYAVVRITAESNLEKAEYAIMVSRALSGKGLGKKLMTHIIEYAKKAGLKEIYGEVLSDNTSMLALNKKLGFEIKTHPEDSGLKEVRLIIK